MSQSPWGIRTEPHIESANRAKRMEEKKGPEGGELKNWASPLRGWKRSVLSDPPAPACGGRGGAPGGGAAERARPGPPGSGRRGRGPGARPALCTRELNGAMCVRAGLHGLGVLSHGLQKNARIWDICHPGAGCSGCKVASENGEPRDRPEVDPAKMTRKPHLRRKFVIKNRDKPLAFVVANNRKLLERLFHPPSSWEEAVLATPGTEGHAAWLCGDRWPLLIMLARSSMVTSGHQLLTMYIE
ncbi:uncharacterized protein LOC107513989 [Rousettus aegyptiacus]|nr:uncharacterized protein LOC107513989 [Rousettus aegyptiacus]